MISTITATQKFNAIHPIIRVNATELYVYRLRNMKDLDTFIDEVSAVLDKKTLLELYNIATAEPYSFLYVKLTAKNRDQMFFQNHTKRFMIHKEYWLSICKMLQIDRIKHLKLYLSTDRSVVFERLSALVVVVASQYRSALVWPWQHR